MLATAWESFFRKAFLMSITEFPGKHLWIKILVSAINFTCADIFSSTFLQPVNGRQNSILNWVMKLSLLMCSKSLKDFPFYSPVHLPDYFHSQKVSEMHFPVIWRPKFQKSSQRWWIKQLTNSKETESLEERGCRQVLG